MKKIILHSLVFLSMVTTYDARALSLNDFLSPAVGIAATAVCLVGAPIAYLIGSKSSDAQRIQQERLYLQEKNEQEKQKNLEEAKRFLIEIKVEYAQELDVVMNGYELTQEELARRASAKFNHETPFVHVSYARKLQDNLTKFRACFLDYSDTDREVAERLETELKKIFERHNLVFRSVLAKELVDEKKALAEQQKLDHQEAIRKEELHAKKLETQYLESLKKGLNDFRDQSQREIEKLSNNALHNQNKMAEYSAAMHATNIADHSKILHDIRYEITNNGLRSLASSVHDLCEEFIQLRREGTLAFREAQKINLRIDELKNNLEQIKNMANQAKIDGTLQKKEVDKIFKKIDNMEGTLAVISADVGDIKSGNFNSEPSAPHF